MTELTKLLNPQNLFVFYRPKKIEVYYDPKVEYPGDFLYIVESLMDSPENNLEIIYGTLRIFKDEFVGRVKAEVYVKVVDSYGETTYDFMIIDGKKYIEVNGVVKVPSEHWTNWSAFVNYICEEVLKNEELCEEAPFEEAYDKALATIERKAPVLKWKYSFIGIELSIDAGVEALEAEEAVALDNHIWFEAKITEIDGVSLLKWLLLDAVNVIAEELDRQSEGLLDEALDEAERVILRWLKDQKQETTQ